MIKTIYYKENREKCLEYIANYYKENKEKIAKYCKERQKEQHIGRKIKKKFVNKERKINNL